jgi:hypothetical protein
MQIGRPGAVHGNYGIDGAGVQTSAVSNAIRIADQPCRRTRATLGRGKQRKVRSRGVLHVEGRPTPPARPDERDRYRSPP